MKLLKQLEKSRNNLTNLDVFCKGGFLALRKLDLSFNNIKDVDCIRDIKDMETLILSNNKIDDLNSLLKMSRLLYLYADNNNLTNVRFISNLRDLLFLDLSFNQIEDIKYLRKLKTMKHLNVNNNHKNLTSFEIFSNSSFGRLSHLDIFTKSSISNVSNNQNIKHENLPDINKIFIGSNQLNLFQRMINKKPYNQKYKFSDFKESIFLILKDDLDYLDCDLTLSFLKNDVLFNLFHQFQVDNYLTKCKLSL